MHDPTKSPGRKIQQFRYQHAHFCDRRLRLRYRDIGHRASDAFGFSSNFHVLKGYHRSPTGVRHYDQDDFDIVGLVALSENVVKFTTDRRQSHRIALSEIESLRATPCASFDRAMKDLGLSDSMAATNTLGGQG